MQKRALTVNFQRSVGSVPVVMEVAINPLNVANAPDLDATLIGREHRDVLLSQENNPVVFQLVPTDHPDLTQRIVYRIAWREKYMGRVVSKDFVMPDFDVDFDDLEDLNLIIGGETYVQWSDVGVPNGVAATDEDGNVLDADGNIISGTAADQVTQDLAVEVAARIQADTNLRSELLASALAQITEVYATVGTNINQAVTALQNVDTIEKGQRELAVSQLNQALTTLQNNTNSQILSINQTLTTHGTTLGTKADLVGGKIPSSQLPDIALGTAVSVANQAAMLALTSSQVQPGDFAVRPDGVFFLNASPPSQLSNWVKFTINVTVMSVNGKTGAVVLTAADVNARPAGVAIAQSDITGLASSLALKTDSSLTNAINARLQAVENDATIVKLVSGTIPKSAMPSDVAFLNSSNLIVRKDGSVVDIGGGGLLDISDVNGLTAALAAKVATNDTRLTNARTPVGHKASHATGGSDAITPAAIGARAVGTAIPMADITGLTALNTLVGNLSDTVSTKVDQSAFDTLSTTVGTKANSSTVTALTTTVGTKANQSDLTALTTTVSNKADKVSGVVPVAQIPDIGISKVTNLTSTLASKADLATGVVPLSQLPSYAISKVTNLQSTLDLKADLVNGQIPTNQIPSIALSTTYTVASRAAMLALTTTQVQRGDVAVITTTTDKGSYILNGDDPSVFANWVMLSAPDGTVASVNGKNGVVVLSASDVGARPTGVALDIADVNLLQSSLDAKAATTALNAKYGETETRALISQAVSNKQRADYVATSAVASLSGLQSVDGVLVTAGSIILLTAQSSSVNNGLWVASASAWTRTTDMATGQYFVRGTQVIVRAGTANANTVWNETAASGVVGTAANNWTKVLTAGEPQVYTASAGVKKIGNDIQLDPATGGGIIVSSGQARLDPSIAARKYAGDVPSGSFIATITHNLNSLDVTATFRDKTLGDAVLVGWRVTGVNTISAEFNTIPTTGQWRVTVIG